MAEPADVAYGELSDEQLAALCVQTQPVDQQAWRAFYNRFYEQVWRIVRLKGIPEADAQDVIQAIFVKAFRSFHGSRPYNPNVSKVITYLGYIIHSVITDHYRSARRHAALSADEDDAIIRIPSGTDGALLLDAADLMIRQNVADPKTSAIMRDLVYGREPKQIARTRSVKLSRVYDIRKDLKVLLRDLPGDPRIGSK